MSNVMHRRILAAFSVAMILSWTAHAAAQPATAPATAPAGAVTLDGGRLVINAPRELTLAASDNLSARYNLGVNEAMITIIATPQRQGVPRDVAGTIAGRIGKHVREQAARGELDMVMPPRVEDDPRFLLRVHDRFNTDDFFADRVQLYRAVGLYLVNVDAIAYSDDPEKAKRVHDLAGDLLLDVRVSKTAAGRGNPSDSGATTRPARPIPFPNARVRVLPPPLWIAETNENPSGIIATWRDPSDQTSLITLSVRPLPPQARRDPALRDIAVDEIVAAEEQSFRIGGAQVVGERQVISDDRFLRKVRIDYEHQGKRFRVTSRQVRAGDVVASVTIVALDDKADAVDALADKVALDIKPMSSR